MEASFARTDTPTSTPFLLTSPAATVAGSSGSSLRKEIDHVRFDVFSGRQSAVFQFNSDYRKWTAETELPTFRWLDDKGGVRRGLFRMLYIKASSSNICPIALFKCAPGVDKGVPSGLPLKYIDYDERGGKGSQPPMRVLPRRIDRTEGYFSIVIAWFGVLAAIYYWGFWFHRMRLRWWWRLFLGGVLMFLAILLAGHGYDILYPQQFAY